MNVIIRVIFVIYGIRMALLDSVNYKILYFWRKLYLLQIYKDFIYWVL